MNSSSNPNTIPAVDPGWREAVRAYGQSSLRRSLWQVINTLVPYAALWIVMLLSLEVSYWLTLALAIPAGGFLVRTFIIFHDCGHGSFFKSRRANNLLGTITGVLTFTPYFYWRHSHAVHHATSGDLDRRGTGDVWTLTVQEYLESPPWRKLAYRIYRQPLIIFGVGPLVEFLVLHRLGIRDRSVGQRERRSVLWTNLALLVVAVVMSALVGWRAYLLVQFPIIWVAATAGVWLFYVQHQFEATYWRWHPEWDFATAAVHGSSFYRLPRVLQWFSGNIGFHHIHHLSPRIPNYLLEACYDENPIFQEIEPLTLRSSLRSATFRLWDEEQQVMVGYGYLKALKQGA